MKSSKNYHLGLLYLTHLLISADGVIDEKEFVSLLRIKNKENIPDHTFKEFEDRIRKENEKEIYKNGMELINECTDEEKLNAFAHLYNMSDVDGTVHVKEVRLLLYSIKAVHIEFDDVVKHAKNQSH
ncbi:MAG: hypothetical protein RI909_1578 [Bacteroidota bacterium]|jgi:uncharacterized tellurite resistance protein B-like protein